MPSVLRRLLRRPPAPTQTTHEVQDLQQEIQDRDRTLAITTEIYERRLREATLHNRDLAEELQRNAEQHDELHQSFEGLQNRCEELLVSNRALGRIISDLRAQEPTRAPEASLEPGRDADWQLYPDARTFPPPGAEQEDIEDYISGLASVFDEFPRFLAFARMIQTRVLLRAPNPLSHSPPEASNMTVAQGERIRIYEDAIVNVLPLVEVVTAWTLSAATQTATNASVGRPLIPPAPPHLQLPPEDGEDQRLLNLETQIELLRHICISTISPERNRGRAAAETQRTLAWRREAQRLETESVEAERVTAAEAATTSADANITTAATDTAAANATADEPTFTSTTATGTSAADNPAAGTTADTAGAAIIPIDADAPAADIPPPFPNSTTATYRSSSPSLNLLHSECSITIAALQGRISSLNARIAALTNRDFNRQMRVEMAERGNAVYMGQAMTGNELRERYGEPPRYEYGEGRRL